MMEELGLAVLCVLTGVVSYLALSVRKTLELCRAELSAAREELARIRAQLGSPQHAVYRLVAAPSMAEPPRPSARVPDRPNPA